MKLKLIFVAVLTSTLLSITSVEAMGSAKVEFKSKNNVKQGETFTVTMSVTDINDTYDGVVSFGGNLSFDTNSLELVSVKEKDAPYRFQINQDYDYKIAGLDFTLENGIYNNLVIYEFNFKALKEGNYVITLENAKLTDSDSYIETTVIEKNITVKKEEKITKNNPKKNVKEEIKDEKTVTKEIVETGEKENKELPIITFQETLKQLISRLKMIFK